ASATNVVAMTAGPIHGGNHSSPMGAGAPPMGAFDAGSERAAGIECGDAGLRREPATRAILERLGDQIADLGGRVPHLPGLHRLQLLREHVTDRLVDARRGIVLAEV